MADGATTASGSSGGQTVSGGPAAGAGLLASLNKFFKQLVGIKLPLMNPLFNYASYEYILGISPLTADSYNNPDSTYMAGKKLAIVAKSAGTDPNNRIRTAYGKFDFFIDNLEIKSLIGNEKGNNTNAAGKFTFTITEPYSMGLFPIAIQQAADTAGHPNWRDAPFLLTIQFRGNKEDGTMQNIPSATRFIPFMFTKLDSKTDHRGTVYQVEALPYNAIGFSDRFAQLKSPISITGTTVQEMLQTGEKSLQAALNKKEKQVKEDGTVPEEQVEYLILFPTDVSSSGGSGGSGGSATVAPGATGETALFKKLGVTKNEKNNLIQAKDDCNVLGKAEMKFSIENKGSTPSAKDNITYSKDQKGQVRANMVINYKESDFKFTQGSDVVNAINQTLLQSKFPGQTMDMSQLSAEGYRGWWRIETQVFIKNSDKNLATTGKFPKLVVYRVVPWDVHVSSGPMAPGVQAPGFDNLAKQAVKVYNYIYTGKNRDIINFNIEYNAAYTQLLNSDGFKRSIGVKRDGQESGKSGKQANLQTQEKGEKPNGVKGANPRSVEYAAIGTGSDGTGGGGNEDPATRAARQFHDVLMKSAKEMVKLNMTIIGDPYYIAQSGLGNYNAKPSQFKNLNSDTTINGQNGEVDIIVNFRSPVDINQTTGLYNYAGVSKSAPVLGYSGLYRINFVTHKFRGGQFTQELELLRRATQEFTRKATAGQIANSKTPGNPPEEQTAKEADPAASYGGSSSNQEQSGT